MDDEIHAQNLCCPPGDGDPRQFKSPQGSADVTSNASSPALRDKTQHFHHAEAEQIHLYFYLHLFLLSPSPCLYLFDTRLKCYCFIIVLCSSTNIVKQLIENLYFTCTCACRVENLTCTKKKSTWANPGIEGHFRKLKILDFFKIVMITIAYLVSN